MKLMLIVIAAGVIGFSLAASGTATTPIQSQEAVIPLQGLDPVLLVDGKEVPGSLSIFVVRGPYKYLFKTPENKAAFERDPERYEIQLGGSCARMGPQVGGGPDRFAVYKGRIYVFGSDECQQRFEAEPEKYLEPTEPPLNASPEALKRGKELIDKALTAMGGAARLDAITGYVETKTAVSRTQNGESEYKITTTRAIPDRVRREQERPFGTVIDIIAPGGSFTAFRNSSGINTRPMRDVARADIFKSLRRTSLEVLLAHREPDFKAVASGTSSGDAHLEQVAVSFGAVRVRLGIEPGTGRVVSLAWLGRDRSTGEVGEIVQTLSDFRTVEGLSLPFKTSGTFKGNPDPQQSSTIESIAFDRTIDQSAFEKPAK
jgi:YHS domain-containing protein